MSAWIVGEGYVIPFDLARLPDREWYGRDWIYVEAPDEAGALDQAETWDADMAPLEARLFASAYREGLVGLPGDRRLTLDGVAAAAGVQRNTVQSWRSRHATFPEPADVVETSPVWWWSDVARWLSVPRRPGRPRKG